MVDRLQRLESEFVEEHRATLNRLNAYAIGSDLTFQNYHLVCVRKLRSSSKFSAPRINSYHN